MVQFDSIEAPHIPPVTTEPADLQSSLLYRTNQTLIEALLATGQRAARAQSAFLETVRSSVQEFAQAISPNLSVSVPQAPALFTRRDMEEFATGSISRCFGPEYQVFEGRRYPRIPNGDLLLMDRVVDIQGTRHHLDKGGTITTEFDVSPSAWFYSTGYAQLPPYAVLMEMALQPCGMLSAYLGTSFPLRDVELFFRNLDGEAQVLARPDLRGKTVTARADLLASTLSGTTIIQKYAFSLSCDGQPFYTGQSVFGYFSASGMASQVGLDGGRVSPPPSTGVTLPSGAIRIPLDRASAGQLGLLDEMVVIPGGGSSRQGQIIARQKIDPRDWFYRCHFHQDAVMPGSLGVEAALQAISIFAGRTRPSLAVPVQMGFPTQRKFIWKYRGQVLPSQSEMSLLIDILSRETAADHETITANASVWVDRTRIYELSGLALTFSQSN